MNSSKIAILLAIVLLLLTLWAVINQVKENHLQDDPMLDRLRKMMKDFFEKRKGKFNGLLTQLNHKDIMEEIRLYKGEKSYTINKEKIYMCLLDEEGKYYDLNLLVYVLLHEMSHVLCDEIGHTQKFSDIFDELKHEAATAGIYNPSLHIRQDYCTYND